MRIGGSPLAAVASLAPAFASSHSSSSSTVDLGYATYQGYYNDTHGLNVWKGIRYAAPPVGKRRWQAPQPPPVNNSAVTLAVDQPPLCPQTGALGVPEVYGFNSGPGDEDCLFLNVYAAPDASGLPVLVWIHGGGYSDFGAVYDPSAWMNSNDNGFITVEIQYRLGAFGFLSSADVAARGRLNACLLDQRFALEWVRAHIAKFGGDPGRVTVGGESSGAGSVMYHSLARGGEDSDLFNNVIAASPYTPAIYRFDHPIPTGHYDAFAELAGCGTDSEQLRLHPSVLDCLVAANSSVLQNASGTVSTTQGYFGSFAFLPVMDGDYVREPPSLQLSLGNVSGKRLLVGNNANDGVPLTNPEVETRKQYDRFIRQMFPLLTPDDIASLNGIYEIDQAQEYDHNTRFDTLGDVGPRALNQSGFATGIQQAAFNIAAESVFGCPAQWLAEAFSMEGRVAWKYQYSVTPSYHGADLSSYFAVDATIPNRDFRHAMQKILGQFITSDAPIITVADATANHTNATVPIGADGGLHWPAFTIQDPRMMDLNTTGGATSLVTVTPDLSYYVREGVGIVNQFRLADAYSWEGGRGKRCAFWRELASRSPPVV
ncbi:Alpha/Beta hydrolase protein [Xylariomycetidae sp. FL0641]|nr:Alpha/Beta hydrolase protein [Xylariomycetidae sp. FL0641]